MEKEKGFLSSVWTAQAKGAKWLSLGGLLLWGFLSAGAVNAAALTPDPGLLDIGGQFYTAALGTFANNIVPGTEIILSAAFNLFADFILPGAGTVLSGLIEAASLTP